MFLNNYVAIVPRGDFEVDSAALLDELLHVGAALQTQVTRDVGPLWGVNAIVSVFRSIAHVPPSYGLLAVVPPGTLKASGEHGFHLAPGGQPIGLVERVPGWPLLASHELVEIVCDPSNKRSVRGLSLRDVQSAAGVDVIPGQAYAEQGQVEYLVEVCDPCQSSTYEINGVLVSDFVTPQYYAPFDNAGARFSFKGTIAEARQLLPGGYISWSTQDGEIWQAYAEIGVGPLDQGLSIEDVVIAPLAGIGPQLARNWVDFHSSISDRPDARQRLERQLVAEAAERYSLASRSAERYGQQLDEAIDEILETLDALDNMRPASDRAGFIRLFEHLSIPGNETERREYAANPEPFLRAYDIKIPTRGLRPGRVQTADQFGESARALRDNDRFGPDLGPVGIRKFIAATGSHIGR